jgi:hypothetical protein
MQLAKKVGEYPVCSSQSLMTSAPGTADLYCKRSVQLASSGELNDQP